MNEKQTPPLYLIVVDPSLNRTGWAVFDITPDQNPKLKNYGYIDNNHFQSGKTGNKLIHIEMVMQTLKFAYYPAIVIKEEWVGQNKNKFGNTNTAAITAYLLAGVHNTIVKVFNQHQIEDINNKQFKKSFTGNGNAEKSEVEAEVQKYRSRIWHRNNPLIIRTDDESDSIGIGIDWLIKKERIKKII